LDTSSLALHYLHGLPRRFDWVLWLWRRLRGEILVHVKPAAAPPPGSLPAAAAQLDTSSLALHYLHGLPRRFDWVLWLWRRLRGEI
ncbi:hypothetical protein CQA70_29345, partial [Klebsiella pneumoniae]